VISYDDNGKPKTKNVLGGTKIECLKKLEKLKDQCGTNSAARTKSDMLFGDWIDFWYGIYSKQSLRATTQAGYEDCIYKHIIPEIGKIPLNKLTQNDLQQFYARLKKSGRLIRQNVYGE